MDVDVGLDRNVDIWRQSCLKTNAAIDQELKQHTKIDSFHSGTTALTIVKQGENLIVANDGDSRGCVRPNLPEEVEQIRQSKGLVFCLHDEPGVYKGMDAKW
ncbi:hypothetical protein LWI28_009952 [Acer negundo]|uniref:PPM-type phosphatase domain-containing protein n=1 Tax=Acer negundo TaxID=4023 RepID=A0AAD5JMN6_ACENE|nr:hypothetical protein LWI28_009952 [Acer negundo]